jgi:hypothetical protein
MTTREVFRLLVELPWIVFVVYWIIAGLKTRPTRSQEAFTSRYTILLIEVVGYALIFIRSTGIGILETRFMPRSLAAATLGVILTWVRYWVGNLGSLSPGGKLERQDHDQGRPSAYQYRSVLSLAAPHLLRHHSCDHRIGNRN